MNQGNGKVDGNKVFAFENVQYGINVYIQEGQDEKTREPIGKIQFVENKQGYGNQWIPALGGLIHPPVQAGIPQPDRHIFQDEAIDTTEHMLRQPQPVFKFIKAEHPTPENPQENGDTGGIYVHLEGVKYPTKGFPTPESCNANGLLKRTFISLVRWIGQNPLAILSLIRRKNLTRLLMELSYISDSAMKQYYLTDNRYNKANRQLRIGIESFIRGLGLKPDSKGTEVEQIYKKSALYYKFPLAIVTMLEYDNAYMLRLQDMANETTAEELIKHPRKELLRLVGLFKQREPRMKMHDRIESLAKILLWGLYVPRVRRAWKQALNAMDWKQVQMDEADRYHVLRLFGYDVLGRTFEDRAAEFLEIHDGVSPKAYIMQSTHEYEKQQQNERDQQNTN